MFINQPKTLYWNYKLEMISSEQIPSPHKTNLNWHRYKTLILLWIKLGRNSRASNSSSIGEGGRRKYGEETIDRWKQVEAKQKGQKLHSKQIKRMSFKVMRNFSFNSYFVSYLISFRLTWFISNYNKCRGGAASGWDW